MNEETRIVLEAEPEVTEKPEKKAKVKNRPIEELMALNSTRGMSPSEMSKLIIALREELTAAEAAVDGYRANAQSAYEQLRAVTNKYDALKDEANAKLRFVHQACQTLLASVGFALKGEHK